MTDEDSAERTWEARADGRPCAVAMVADGLRITGTDSEETTHYGWAELRGVSFPDGFTVEIRTTAGRTVALTFHAGATQRELRNALQGKVAVVAAEPRPGPEPLDLDALPQNHAPGSQPLTTTVLGVGVVGLGVRLGLEEHAWRNPGTRTRARR